MNDFEKYCRNRIKYSFFRFLFLIILGIIVFALSNKLNLFADKVYALETTTMYRNASLSTTGFLYTTDSSLSGTIKNGSVNTVYADASYGISFFINKGTVPGKVYKIRLNFNDYDYLHSNSYDVINISNGDECSIIGYQLINQGGQANQAKGVDVTYLCLNAGNYTGVNIGKYIEGTGYKRITTINWRINNVQWEQVDDREAEQIIANATINTQNIINNQNQNTQDIIAGQSSQTDRIINNQNQNTQDMIDSQKVCNVKKYDANDVKDDDKYLTSSGGLGSQDGYGVSDYIDIKNVNSINVLNAGQNNICFYDNNKSYISCLVPSSTGILTVPSNANFIRITFNKTYNRPIIEIDACKDGNQAISDNLSDLKDALTDDSPVNMDSLGDTAGWLPPGPIDSIINLPINFFNSLTISLSGSCQPLSVPLPYLNENMEIPCISTIFSNITGLDSFWTWVGVICTVVILYNYLISLYNYYDKLTSMKETSISDFGGEP